MWKNSSPNDVSRLITSPSTAGYKDSPHSSSTQPRPCRHAVGDRWFVEETYVRVAGVWRYVYRAVDQYGQVIDVYVSKRRNLDAARHFFTTALSAHGRPVEVTTDLAAPLLRVVEELLPDVVHDTEQYSK